MVFLEVLTKKLWLGAVWEDAAFALRDCKNTIKKLIAISKTAKITGGLKSELRIEIVTNALNIELEQVTKNKGASIGTRYSL